MKGEFKPNIIVLIRIAEAFYENTHMKKTHIHSVSRIRWNSFVRYLIWLKSNNYLESMMHGKEELYKLTVTGREMFNMLLKFHEHLISTKTIIA